MSCLAPRLLANQSRIEGVQNLDESGCIDLHTVQPTPEKRQKALDGARREYSHYLTGFRLGGPNCEALRELLALCRERDIRTALVLMPEGPTFRTWYPPGVWNEIQTYLNELAPNFSKSVLTKIRVYLNSILDEAVELEFISKNQAAKLAVPRSGKKVTGVHLTPEQIPAVLFNLSDRDRLIVRMFLVLGLRPGELFALRWNDKAQNSLRIDTSITDGIEVETKTECSSANVWLPVSIETELEWWRSASKDAGPEMFIFPSARGTAINTNNFLFRVLKEAGRQAGIDGVTHQMLRRTCSTYMAQLTSVKDVQAHLRHTNAKTTLEHYIKSVPESVRVAVESLDHLLKSRPGADPAVRAN